MNALARVFLVHRRSEVLHVALGKIERGGVRVKKKDEGQRRR